jgi:hypothetical protein
MRTAIQELIDELERVRLMTNMNFVIRIANDLLEKEKEQIIKARIDGDENYSLVGGKRYEYAEQYYNETYNQNK